MPRIIIVSAQGVTFGLGHFKRCERIANELEKSFPAVIEHWTIDEKDLSQRGGSWIYDWLSEKCAGGLKEDTVVLDIPLKKCEVEFFKLFEILSVASKKIISIDGFAETAHLVDMVYIPSPAVDDVKAFGETPLVYGLDCLLLDEICIDTSSRDNAEVRHCLIVTGGADVFDYLSWLPRLLSTSNGLQQLEKFYVAVGPFVKNRSRLESLSRVQYCYKLPNLVSFKNKVEVAVTTFGVSVYELIALGIHSLVINQSASQVDCAQQFLADAGLITIVIGDENIERELIKLSSNINCSKFRLKFNVARKKFLKQIRPNSQTLKRLISRLIA